MRIPMHILPMNCLIKKEEHGSEYQFRKNNRQNQTDVGGAFGGHM